MATILNDVEIERLLDSVIIRGEESCIRPNSYILRVGQAGEFLNTDKEFSIGDEGDFGGIKIAPGHSIGLTSFEDIDFRRETVHKIYPDCDLHAFITPNTSLSREGIVAPATQIDAGYNGTLIWTLANTSMKERRYLHKANVFRMTIFKLEKGEVPLEPYDGHYQKEFGYVKSKRRDAEVGMRESEWETASVPGGPQDTFEILAKSGPPWDVLTERLKLIDRQFKTVSNEYSDIKDETQEIKNEIRSLRSEVTDVCKGQETLSGEVKKIVEKTMQVEFLNWHYRWIVTLGQFIMAIFGLSLIGLKIEPVMKFLKDYTLVIGIVLFGGAFLVSVIPLIMRRKK